MADLIDACKEVSGFLREIAQIRNAPDEPIDETTRWPFAVTFPSSGNYHTGPPGVMTCLANISVELHVARKDLPRDFTKSLNIIDLVPNKLYTKLKDSAYSTIATFGDIPFVFGPSEWGGTPTLAVIYTIEDVKLQTTL